MSYVFTSQNIGITNSNFYVTPLIASGTSIFDLSFSNVVQGIYEVLISNFSIAESWLGYVNWYPGNPFSVVATTIVNNIGATTPSSGTLRFTGLQAGNPYWITIRYVGRNYA